MSYTRNRVRWFACRKITQAIRSGESGAPDYDREVGQASPIDRVTVIFGEDLPFGDTGPSLPLHSGVDVVALYLTGLGPTTRTGNLD